MSNFHRLIAFAFVAALCGHQLHGSGTRVMGIEEMYQLAESQSSSLRSSAIGVSVADAAIADAKAARLPDISTQLSVSYLGDGYLWDRNFGNGMSVDMPHFGNNFVLKASQAIYTGGAVSSQINLAKLGKQMAQNHHLSTRNDVRFMLVGYYLQLATLDNQVQVYDRNIELTKKVISQMQVRQKEGTVLKNDITRYELQLENINLQRTRTIDNRKIVNHRLVTILGLDTDTDIVPDNNVIDKLPEKSSEGEWQSRAALQSPVLKGASLNIGMKREQERLAKADRLPKIAIVAEEHLDGPITIEVPVIDSNFNYWYAGIGISYNISSLFKSNKKIRQAAISTQQARQDHITAIQNVENSVQAAYTNYLTTFTDLHTQEKSVELARQNYQVVNNRYDNGLALITDMTDAANMKLSAELALVNSRINVVYSYYNLQFASGSL